jgi:hypothetical protein
VLSLIVIADFDEIIAASEPVENFHHHEAGLRICLAHPLIDAPFNHPLEFILVSARKVNADCGAIVLNAYRHKPVAGPRWPSAASSSSRLIDFRSSGIRIFASQKEPEISRYDSDIQQSCNQDIRQR